jgi:large subunit ribosomal protein L25
MEAQPFPVQARTELGKGAARKIRSKGLIPGVIYRAGGEPTHVSLDPYALRSLFKNIGNPNALISLDVDDNSYICLLKDADKHPVSRSLIHVDFYEVDAKEVVTVEVPVTIVGVSLGAAQGGRIRTLRHTVRITAKPGDIPAEIAVDVSQLDVGMVVSAGELDLPDGCVVAMEESFNLLRCIGKRAELVVETTALDDLEEGLEEGEEAGEEGAEDGAQEDEGEEG